MRRVCVFTGSRSDYGPMQSVIEALHAEPGIDLRLLATGGHLVGEQGYTVRQIEADGFTVDERVEMVLAGDSPTAVAKSFGLGVIGYADALDRIGPDILVLPGDRYEALAAAVAAALRLLPIAHVGGGEATSGATDESVRHAITKLAHLHFTSTERFRDNVVQLGENPSHVHLTGTPGLDTIRTATRLDRSALAAELGVELRTPTIGVTYHPATADPGGSTSGIAGLLTALDAFPEATVVFTGTNVDQTRSGVATAIHACAARRPGPTAVLPSLGQVRYLSLVHHADVVVGNSSSGVIEVPAMHTPTVNIGTRQDGRPRAKSVLDCGEDPGQIERAIRHALTPGHQRVAAEARSPYGDGHAAERIVAVLRTVELATLPRKRFFSYPLAGTDRAGDSLNAVVSIPSKSHFGA
ncbi:UDP-N-acetylglucosamine 2-epimerase [Prauserella flavalba]|uniref:UDP-N-acetyl-D-glucosamine 2-epimerase, UDP-hydrolysing n=1 Tax=Prauserella flavalba TaxID=1477506 RepID=A0A318LKN3_9PSEU|nr:UDP-N-acetylglucosamine 2-epimerase [Prauserella flavalba]PXY28653.1 UDP-N-acetyl-D-glucosamine 2-epimerase, UDP-hydrolysing [Prauserella flavalba]